jgi:hypothetical protein
VKAGGSAFAQHAREQIHPRDLLHEPQLMKERKGVLGFRRLYLADSTCRHDIMLD